MLFVNLSRYTQNLERFCVRKHKYLSNSTNLGSFDTPFSSFGKKIHNHHSLNFATVSQTSTAVTSPNTHVISSIVEGRGNAAGEIGMATIDIYRANIEVSQYQDTSSYSRTSVKLLVLCPTEIIIPKPGLDPNSCMQKLVQILQTFRSSMSINGVNRNLFNDRQGLQDLKRLCHPEYLASIHAIKEKFYALSAVSALLQYAEEIHGLIYAPKSVKFTFSGSVKTTMIDVKSAKRLNLVENNFDRTTKGTFYSAIDYTCTAGGARMLRTNILEPPCDLPTILNRQASVSELVSCPETLLNVQNILKQFPYIDGLLSLCVQICTLPTFCSSSITSLSNYNKYLYTPKNLDKSSNLENLSNSWKNVSNSIQKFTKDHSVLVSTLKTPNSPYKLDQQKQQHYIVTDSGSNNNNRKYSPTIKKSTNIQAAESRITRIIAIKHSLNLVKLLHNAMDNVKSNLLLTYKELLEDPGYEKVLTTLCTVLHEDVHLTKGVLAMRTQKCFAIKEGLNIFLDVTRKAYSEQLDEIVSEVNRLSHHYKLPLKLAHNKARGFYIQIAESAIKVMQNKIDHKCFGSSSYDDEKWSTDYSCLFNFGVEIDDTFTDYHSQLIEETSNKECGFDYRSLPKVFIKSYTSRGIVHCTTESLIRMNERIKGSLNEVYFIADQIICDLIAGLHPEMSLFYRLSEVVASLDFLSSLARLALSGPPGSQFVHPLFCEILAIKNCRNIVIDHQKKLQSVANNVYASPDLNFHVITGPNMSGKTSYLQQLAYVQILAQIGSFIPAEFATIRITDQIFMHSCGQDELTLGESSFTYEIIELTYILGNFTRSSLILIDGLCQNTDPNEAEYLSVAICEAFLQHKSFTFLATNRSELTELAFIYTNVENYHFLVHEEYEDIINNTLPCKNERSLEHINVSDQFSYVMHESPLVPSCKGTIQIQGEIQNLFAKTTINEGPTTFQNKCHFTFTYKLLKGVSRKMFGLKLARLTPFPACVLNRAEELLQIFLRAKPANQGEFNPEIYEKNENQITQSMEQCERSHLNQTISAKRLTIADRLEQELKRQVYMLSKAYANISYNNLLQKQTKEAEIVAYLKFLKDHYKFILNEDMTEE